MHNSKATILGLEDYKAQNGGCERTDPSLPEDGQTQDKRIKSIRIHADSRGPGNTD